MFFCFVLMVIWKQMPKHLENDSNKLDDETHFAMTPRNQVTPRHLQSQFS